MKRGILLLFLFVGSLFFQKTSATNIEKNRSYDNTSKLHPVHVSFATVEYDTKNESFRILFRIFVDDFDLILSRKYGKEIKMSEGKWGDDYLKIVNKYLLEHFKLIVDGKNKTKSLLNFSKKELKEQAIWLYFDSKSKLKGNDFIIHNSLMTDLYSDQKNLLIFICNGKQEGFTFSINKTKEEFRL